MNVRNIGIFAHIDAGKSTLTERLLYESGRIAHPGSILEGTTESDFHSEEIARGISIYNSVFQFDYTYEGSIYQINLIDTPGHLDFASQVESAFHAIDVAILLIDVGAGIQSQTDLLYHALVRAGIPVIVFINKTDKHLNRLPELYLEVETLCFHKTIPLFSLVNNGIKNAVSTLELPDEIKIKTIEWDSELSTLYLANPSDLNALSRQGMEKGFRQSKVFPVVAGSALQGEGIASLLAWICILEPGIQFKHDAAGVVFKKFVFNDFSKYLFIKFFKKYTIGETLYCRNQPLQFDSLYKVFGADLEEIESVDPFSIGVVQAVFPVLNGEYLYFKTEVESNNPVILEQKHYGIVIEPESEGERGSLQDALELLVFEDDGLSASIKDDTGQMEVWGRGELHLEVAMDRLKTLFRNKFGIGKLKVVRYDRLKILVKNVIFRHSVYGGEQESGELTVSLEKTNDFRNETVFETELPDLIQTSIQTAFNEVMSHGVSGREIIGTKFKVLSYREPAVVTDETFRLVKVAVISGLKKLIEDNTETIGPVSFLEIIVPQGDIGLVSSELQRRKARIANLENTGDGYAVIKAESAAENLLGFAAELRNMTQGRGFLYINTLFDLENFAII